ncbi:MAG: type II secretion system F family protein [Chromatiales bacterium]|nr:type II secretion system F family protein [Chromatiales bacterium]
MRAGAATAPLRERADVLTALGRSLQAGLTARRALAALAPDASPHLRERLRAASRDSGGTIASALAGAGLAPARDRAQIEAAETAGCLAAALSRLGARHTARAARRARVRARSALPLLVALLALVLLPLPALVAGRLDPTWWVVRTVLVVGIVALGGRWLLRRLAAALDQPAAGVLERAMTRLPLVGRMLADERRLAALEAVHGLLVAGVPASMALERALGPAAGGGAGRAAVARVAGGGSLAQALDATELTPDRHHAALLASAEVAGRLDDALERGCAALAADLDSRATVLADWLPRLLHALVAVLVAGSILG